MNDLPQFTKTRIVHLALTSYAARLVRDALNAYEQDNCIQLDDDELEVIELVKAEIKDQLPKKRSRR